MSGQTIAGNVALVTGANRGIGKAIAEELLARGASKVYAGARRTETLEQLMQEHPGRVVPLELDVTSDEQVSTLADRALDVAIVVNNAGIAQAPIGAAISDRGIFDAARAEIDVNYLGTLRVIQALAPVLAKNGGGAIVNIASVVALTGFPAFGSYSASKAAVRSLTQTARVHLAGQGTQVVGVYPGPVDTDMATDIPLQKVSPASVAAKIVDAIEAGTLEVYPDPFSEEFGVRFESSPSGLEAHVAASAAAA